jgi:four helix bundle protein
MYRKTRFRPKKPIRSFRDLEVYQRTFDASVEVMKKIVPNMQNKEYPLRDQLIDCCLGIPNLIAEAHGKRFDEEKESLGLLDEAMTQCNKMVVYLEQVRDIFSDEVDRVVIEEIIKKYVYARKKILNLYKAWKKFQEESADKKE